MSPDLPSATVDYFKTCKRRRSFREKLHAFCTFLEKVPTQCSFGCIIPSFLEKKIEEPYNGTPLQYSCLESPVDGGAWWAAVPGVAKSDMTERLRFHFSLSRIGEGNGNPLQCSCLEYLRDSGACWAAVYGVAQSRTRLKRLSSGSSSSRALLFIHPVYISFHLLMPNS